MIYAPAYLVALAGLALAGPALAADHGGKSEVAVQEAKAKEKKICKREMAMGSKFTTKICRTAAEWEAEYERDRPRSQTEDKN